MIGDEEQEKPRKRNPLTLPMRYLLHLIIKAIVLLIMGIRWVLRPKPVRYGLLLILLAGAVGWNVAGSALRGPQTAAPPQAATVSQQAASQLPQSPVVEQYLQAQAAYDGKQMWELISDEMKSSMRASDVSLQQLQAELDSARQEGRRYRGATYVGGIPMSQGRQVYFYVLTVDTPAGSTEVPYIYVVGPDGKIVSIQ